MKPRKRGDTIHRPPQPNKNSFKIRLDRALTPLTRPLHSCGVGPNWITLVGVLAILMVPVELLREKWVPAGLWLLGAGFFDVLDGALARRLGVTRPFGAFWDSTLDRVSEAIVFGGLLFYYFQRQNPEGLLLSFGACILSLLVSYTRARAEGLGIECEVGVLPRPGRVLVLALGFVTARPLPALAVVAGLSLVTVAQRVHLVWRKTGR